MIKPIKRYPNQVCQGILRVLLLSHPGRTYPGIIAIGADSSSFQVGTISSNLLDVSL